jgi:hypothetical protein
LVFPFIFDLFEQTGLQLSPASLILFVLTTVFAALVFLSFSVPICRTRSFIAQRREKIFTNLNRDLNEIFEKIEKSEDIDTRLALRSLLLFHLNNSEYAKKKKFPVDPGDLTLMIISLAFPYIVSYLF